ncbi:MAG: HAMP domain-containing protein, partial [Actinomycetota bacterium]|nr:HAMP domain-containing protein [Actinomycetota bacterium]
AQVTTAVARGDLDQKVTVGAKGEVAALADTINSMTDTLRAFANEVTRVAREVGTEGRLGGQAQVEGVAGTWKDLTESVNGMASSLTAQVRDIAQVTTAVANGELAQKITVEVKGEMLELKNTINTMVDQLSSFADEVTRVAREVGTEGKLGGQAEVKGVSGTWKDLTENVNFMASNLTSQVRNIAQVTTAVARGDLSQKISVEAKGEVAALAETINSMTDTLRAFADEVTRVAREVGTEGKLGGQARVEGVSGTWKDLTDSVNLMASNLTAQVRDIVQVTTAVANGELAQKITVDVRGEILELKKTINTMVDQLSSFADEVTRVAREVGTEGRLGGQAKVEGVSGTWRDLTENVNQLASNLTSQVRNIAQVTTAVARGDLSQKISVEAKGEVAALAETINTMVDQLSSFADEVTRVAREVGTEGKLGGQARVEGVSGTWKHLTENVNFMASNLTDQVRDIAQVTTAVANGDLSQKISVEAKGEVAALADTINTMVDQLSSFADEVTRVASEVGTEGKLGGQAQVEGVSGTWRALTENVNSMASNLTDQVRNIAQVATAVAEGDLSQKITVDAKGEILRLKDTINTMVDQLSAFAAEVTRVAREVGTEGKLGGQAQVEGVSGTWRGLTENVNQLAGNLTTQVRAIADVATAVTQGDLTRSIQVAAEGEVAQLKDKINQMIVNLKETTQRNEEQDWLKTNLARVSGLMQGQRDLLTVASLIMSELSPTVNAQHGAFFLAENGDGNAPELKLKASYGYKKRKSVSNKFSLGEGLVGQAALERKPIVVTEAPPDYIKVTSGLGEATPVNITVLPIVFEDQTLGVIELASLRPFSEVNLTFLEQLVETIGVVLNTIIANMTTEELLEQSQRLTQELQSQSEELQTQQEELQQTNEELQEKAALLADQNRNIEIKNREIETARAGLEEKAQQLSLSSKYKSEFLANMSHELRTPLNSLLILAKLLMDNPENNLTEKQIDFARTILNAGSDLLALINDILDLSKVEAGKMEVNPTDVVLEDVLTYADQSFRPLAEEKSLQFKVELGPDVPGRINTDEQRLQQILNNLLSNAFKFTHEGEVKLSIGLAPEGVAFMSDHLNKAERVIAFSVRDTGVGVPQDKLRLIFEAFQQADGTTSRRYGGTGLGLSISREIAGLLGGEIHVESEVDTGSTFTFYAPERWLERRSPTEDEIPSGGAPIGAGPTAVPDMPPPALDGGEVPLDQEVPDDRSSIEAGDRVLLIVDPDADFAATALGSARRGGFRGIVATKREAIVPLAREYRVDAVLLDGRELSDGLDVLRRLKSDSATRHIPVHYIADQDLRREALSMGAATYLQQPITDELLDEKLREVAGSLEQKSKNLLVVEDNDVERASIIELIGSENDVVTTAVGSSEEALQALEATDFDCMVLDLKLPEMTGFDLLEKLKKDDRHRYLPVIIYTGRELTRKEETRLRKYAETIIVKDVRSPERLLAETSLFLHRDESALPPTKRKMIEQVHDADVVFQGKKVLIVDDDVRNVFALTSVLEGRGLQVLYAENGKDGIATLKENPDISLVLMDIMMPEMDGYETTQAIRKISKFSDLPVIALTAKAMAGDRERSIAAGVSDYITKPVDLDQLISLMQVWLYE